jgi:hypothetical protein
MKLVLATGLSLGVWAVAAVGAADPTESGSVQLPPIEIVGRVMRPLATVEVNRLRPQLGVREPARSFLVQTEAAVRSDPF